MEKKKYMDLKKSTSRMVYFFAYKVAMKYDLEITRCLLKAQDIQCDSIQTFDDGRDTKFSTYLYTQLKRLYSWAYSEWKLHAELPDEIYLQIPAPVENNELEVPKHLQKIANAILMGYGIYLKNGKLSDTRKSLKDLSNYTGLSCQQIYLQFAELKSICKGGFYENLH